MDGTGLSQEKSMSINSDLSNMPAMGRDDTPPRFETIIGELMKTCRFPLYISSALMILTSPCFAEDAQVGKTAPPGVQKSDSSDFQIELESPTASREQVKYPYGEPKIEENSDQNGWNALLPANGFAIKSQWKEEPQFQMEYGPDQKFQGAVSLATVQLSHNENIPHTLHLLVYIFDPKSIELNMSSPEAVINQLITAPAKQAEQQGYTIKTREIAASPIRTAGVIEDARRQIAISKDDKGLQSQFYRVLVGKDYVVLALVIGPFEGLEADAQAFFNGISLESKGATPASAMPGPKPTQIPLRAGQQPNVHMNQPR